MTPPPVTSDITPPSWYVYMIRCGDDTLYTGITTDVARRLAEHRRGGSRAARYLKGRGPLHLVFHRRAGTRKAALTLEHTIKKLSRTEKLRLIDQPMP